MRRYIGELPRDRRLLLGFSGGVDSSALFFLLLEAGVEFDLCIVDYGLREQSALEVAYAQDLASKHQKQIHILYAPKLKGNFESQARKIRYEFFGELIKKHDYGGVVLAHQLNDRIEWFLMQFSKGAGLNTLLGFDRCVQIDHFRVFRPLLETSKRELYAFCEANSIAYFEDSSNQNERFTRNKIRKLASFLADHPEGILQSFAFLTSQKFRLFPLGEVAILGDVRSFVSEGEDVDLHRLDLEAKKLGYLLSRKQKAEIVRCGFSCEIASLSIDRDDTRIFIAPSVRCMMKRSYRDFARKNKIPKRLREAVFLSLMQGKVSEEQICDFFVIH